MIDRPTYNIRKSYKYNFENGPFYEKNHPEIHPIGKYDLLNFELNSPLGIAAGLLLNARWVELYSQLGFDILTYKTVRSVQHKAYQNPNCLYVISDNPLNLNPKTSLIATEDLENLSIDKLSITNSFGAPSSQPDKWKEDIEKAKSHLKKGQVLIVSVVGSSEKYPDKYEFIKDFQRCANYAKEAGADIVELDLSCPNSPAAEGEIFTDPDLSSVISKKVKDEIRDTPLFIKIGFFESYNELKTVIKANAPFINGIAGINTIKKKIVSLQEKPVLGEQREQSGVSGSLIREFGLQSARWLVKLRKQEKYDFAIIGIGGAMTPEHIQQYLDTGVDIVQVVTAAMFCPKLAANYRKFVKKVKM